jgi:hypothetical protein
VFGFFDILYQIFSAFAHSPEVSAQMGILAVFAWAVWDYAHSYSELGIFDIICAFIVVPMLMALAYAVCGIGLTIISAILSFVLTPFHFIFKNVNASRPKAQKKLHEKPAARNPHHNARWKQKIPHSPDCDAAFEKQFRQFFNEYQDYRSYQEELREEERAWEEECAWEEERAWEEEQRAAREEAERARRKQEQQRREQQRREQQQNARSQLQRAAMQFFGLEPGFTQRDLKKSYHKFIKRWHPDNNLDRQEFAAAQLRDVTKFYNVLADTAK